MPQAFAAEEKWMYFGVTQFFAVYGAETESGFMKSINVKADWDADASVWVATSEDVPGLVTEAATAEELMNKLQIMIPELLRANGLIQDYDKIDIPLHLLYERSEIITSQSY